MRRWLLWTFYCLRGRRCANLVIDDFESDAPPGSILRLGYECHGCGTVYESTFLVGTDNAVIATGRERLTLERMLEQRRSSGVVIAGGESAEVRFENDSTCRECGLGFEEGAHTEFGFTGPDAHDYVARGAPGEEPES